MAFIIVGKENTTDIKLYYEDHGSGAAGASFILKVFEILIVGERRLVTYKCQEPSTAANAAPARLGK